MDEFTVSKLKEWDLHTLLDVFEDHITAALILIPRIFPSLTVSISSNVGGTKKRKKESWRPSNEEISEGFIVILKNIAQLQEIISIKTNKATSFGLTVQPYVALLCSDPQNELTVTASYVIINKYTFKVETPLKAVDICFKSFFALNLKYPVQSDHVWEFIQKFFYGIVTEEDKKYQCVD
ncbi:uncharacterized protein LOC111027724, partial [Myzus persicae]|uniref:uncharacterized protein LOC111027724 n=1 Tax=Myzus persicae TaxID=13164 RepID=UPI000B9384C8